VVGDVRGASIGIAEGALLRGNVQTGHGAEGQKGRARTGAAAKPAVRAEPRKAPAVAVTAARGNGAPRRAARRAGRACRAAASRRTRVEEGRRAALRKRSR